MIYKYEMACQEAGMSEEEIKKIRQMFDTDYKRLKRRKKAREEAQESFYSLEAMKGQDGEAGSYEPADPSVDIEAEFIRKCEIQELYEALDMLSPDDKTFILEWFELERGATKLMAERYGVTESCIKSRKSRIIKRLREIYKENF